MYTAHSKDAYVVNTEWICEEYKRSLMFTHSLCLMALVLSLCMLFTFLLEEYKDNEDMCLFVCSRIEVHV